MMQKPWFKIFIWFLATFFFYLAAGVVISVFRPGPTETEVMDFMMGMMNAMDRSMMGIAMSMGNDILIQSVMVSANSMALPVIIISIIAGITIRLWQRGSKNV